MLNNLDILVIVAMALMVVSLLALCLMFLVRNKRVKQVCLYIASALGIYLTTVSLRIFWPEFMGQTLLGLVLGAAGIGAIVLERLSKGNEKLLRIAQLMAAASVVVGFLNAFS